MAHSSQGPELPAFFRLYCSPQSFSLALCMFTQRLVADHNSNCLVPHDMDPSPLHPPPLIYNHPFSNPLLVSLEPTLAGRSRQDVFQETLIVCLKRESQTWDKHLPFCCDYVPGVWISSGFKESGWAVMLTESVLLLPQLCSDRGQWPLCSLCPWHNQNSLRLVRLLSPRPVI